jgi:hypothetical protein
MSEVDSVTKAILERRLGKNVQPSVATEENDSEVKNAALRIINRRRARSEGLATEAVQGLTFGLADEFSSAMTALTTDKTYSKAKEEYQAKRRAFKKKNPQLADEALLLEAVASIPTGAGVAAGLGKAGIKSLGKIGAIEAGGYGITTGDTFEERIGQGIVGGIAGFGLGKLVQAATRPASAGGFKTQTDDIATEASDIDDIALQRSIEEEKFIEIDTPKYTRKPLRDAQTVGEFWESAKTAVKEFYNDKNYWRIG